LKNIFFFENIYLILKKFKFFIKFIFYFSKAKARGLPDERQKILELVLMSNWRFLLLWGIFLSKEHALNSPILAKSLGLSVQSSDI
jgi:hypothetical protein